MESVYNLYLALEAKEKEFQNRPNHFNPIYHLIEGKTSPLMIDQTLRIIFM